MLRKMVAVLALTALALPAFANTPQQEKMKTCNADAAAKKLDGDNRKKFMSECLSGGAAEAKPAKELTPQQQKMKDCNADAKKQKLKGEFRQKWMSECLSK